MLEAENLWMNQKQLTQLFGKAKGTVSEHIKHIFEDGELDENSVVRLFRTTAADGKQYESDKNHQLAGFKSRSSHIMRTTTCLIYTHPSWIYRRSNDFNGKHGNIR